MVGLMLFSQLALAVPRPAVAQEPPAKRSPLTYITSEATFVALARPRQVLTAPGSELLPIEVFSALGKKELGIDPLDVAGVLFFVEAPSESRPPGIAAIVLFAAPQNQGGMLPQLVEQTVEDRINGAPYRRANAPDGLSMYQPDDKTLILAHDHLLQKMLAKPAEGTGNVQQLLAQADRSADFLAILSIDPLRPLINAALAEEELPPPLAPLKQIPNQLSVVELSVNFTRAAGATLTATAVDEDAAVQLQQTIDQTLNMGKMILTAKMSEEIDHDDPVGQATMQYLERVSKLILEAIRPVRDGTKLSLSTDRFGDMAPNVSSMAAIGVLVALLLPAIQAAREAARRTQSDNNLKQIALALQNYHDAYRKFPARASVDEDGQPLLSWRVHLLPFLENRALYEQFRLDEPWDSEHNAKLIPLMPDVFVNPSAPPKPGHTPYLGVFGDGLFFSDERQRGVKDVTDGTSNTICVLEANHDRAVVWTKPADWQYDADDPMAGLGNAHPGGFLAAFVDGSVQFIPATIAPETWRGLLTIKGGERVRLP